MAITMCYCLGDLNSVLETPTGYPFIQVFYNATQSNAATNVMVTIIIITLAACCVSLVATCSRQLWSFARDKGVPFSDWLAFVRSSHSDRLEQNHPLTDSTGLAHNAHPTPRHPRITLRNLHRLPHQHRLQLCPQRHRLPRRCRLAARRFWGQWGQVECRQEISTFHFRASV